MDQINSLKTEQRFKNTEIGDIPVDWEIVNIKEVCQNPEYGFTTSAKEEPIGPKLLRITDIQNGDVNWRNVPYCNCPNSLKKRFILKEGDILFARTGATTGKSYIIRECPEAIFASYLIRLRTKEIIESIFLYYLFNSSIYWKQIKQQIGGSAQGGVNATLLSNIKIPLPPLSEQKKIAEVLSTVDETIEKKKSIIEKTKELKKGLMQELLTRGIGHKKFKKTELGEIPLEWKIMSLNDISEEIYRYPTYYNIQYVSQGIPEIRGEIIELNGKLDNDLSKYRFISNVTAARFPRTTLKEGDFVISVRGTMGKAAIIPKFLGGANITANLIRISPNRNIVFPLFLHQVFLSNRFQEILNTASSSTTIKTIKASELKRIKFAIPSIQEQKRIAQILSSWDTKIKEDICQYAKLEDLKNGLMQTLLTGKLRVRQ